MITITTFLNLVERKYGNDTKATVNRYIKLKEKIKTHEYDINFIKLFIYALCFVFVKLN